MADTDPILFVSHVSEDPAAALEIVGELERRGVPCWSAPRSGPAGMPSASAVPTSNRPGRIASATA